MSPKEPVNETNTVEVANSDPIEEIEVLRHNEHIRRRPTLYIGGIGSRGLHQLVFELLSNSLDAFVPDSNHIILVALLKDGSCKVVDDGPGFQVDPSTEEGKRSFELLCTEPGCTTPKFAYSLNASFHGVGLKAVNALSRRMLVEVQNHGEAWRQTFERGISLGPVTAIRDSTYTGTSITFWPDPEIFPLGPACQFSWDDLCNRLRDLAFFYPSVKFCLIDDRDAERQEDIFFYPDGLRDYVRFLNRGEEAVHSNIFHFAESEERERVEIALQWTRSTEEVSRTYCNTHFTIDGGTHLTGFRAGLTTNLKKLLREHGWHRPLLHRDSGTRFRRGLTAVVSVTLRQPAFDGSTKDRLVHSEIESLVQRTFARHFREFLRQHPTDAAAIVGKLQANLSVA